MRLSSHLVVTLLSGLSFAAASDTVQAARPDGVLRLQVVDAETRDPLPARVDLKRGDRPVRSRGLGAGRFRDWFYLDGQAELGLRRGQYTFDLHCGPEFKPLSGHFEIDRRADDGKTIEMHRVVRLQDEGWYGADLLAQRNDPALPVAVRAAGLSYVPLVAWIWEQGKWNKCDSLESQTASPVAFGPTAARMRTDAGDLLFIRPDGAITPQDLASIGQASVNDLRKAKQQGLLIVAADATSWALPVWLASDLLDAIVVVDPADTKQGTVGRWGYPRDGALYPRLRGKGLWREAIYFQLLEAGMHLAPLAASASGENGLPLGSCRVYAAPKEGFSPSQWWQAATAGETLVTNGPLLRSIPFPGKTYRLIEGSTNITVGASLTTDTRVEYIEIIQNGRVAHSVSLREVAASGGRLPAVDCRGSGWFLLRAQASDSAGYQRAMTAPYYYQPLDGHPRISRQACEFFFNWLKEAAGKLDEQQRRAAGRFWQQRADTANAVESFP